MATLICERICNKEHKTQVGLFQIIRIILYIHGKKENQIVEIFFFKFPNNFHDCHKIL